MTFENLPVELQIFILKKLTLKEATRARLVSHDFYKIAKEIVADEINQILKLSVEERAKKIFKEKVNLLGKDKMMKLLANNYAVIALMKGLLDCQKITFRVTISANLLTCNGLEALKAKILPDQFIYLQDGQNNTAIEYCLTIILRNLANAIIALKEKLLIFNVSREFLENALLMRCKYKNAPDKFVLDLLLSNTGIYALRKKILTQQKAANLYYTWHSQSYATYPITFCNIMVTPLPMIAISLGLIALEEFAGEEHESCEIGIRKKCIERFSKETQRLIPEWNRYQLDSPEAYAYIRKLFVDYTSENIKTMLLTSLNKFFHNQEYKAFVVIIKSLLLKPKYAVFNQESLTNFFAELKSLIDYTKIDRSSELQAIIISSMYLSDLKVAFDLIEPLMFLESKPLRFHSI